MLIGYIQNQIQDKNKSILGELHLIGNQEKKIFGSNTSLSVVNAWCGEYSFTSFIARSQKWKIFR